MPETKNKIINFLKEEFINYSDFEISGVNLDTDLSEIGLDSLDLIEITMDLEHEFKIEIDDDEVYAWQTPNDIVNTVLKELGVINE